MLESDLHPARRYAAKALWRLVQFLTTTKRRIADLAFRLDPFRRTL